MPTIDDYTGGDSNSYDESDLVNADDMAVIDALRGFDPGEGRSLLGFVIGTSEDRTLKVDDWFGPIRDGRDVALRADHPSDDKFGYFYRDGGRVVLEWTTGSVETGQIRDTAIEAMADASDCEIEVITESDLPDDMGGEDGE